MAGNVKQEIIAFCTQGKMDSILYLLNKHTAHITVHYAEREMERRELKNKMKRGL